MKSGLELRSTQKKIFFSSHTKKKPCKIENRNNSLEITSRDSEGLGGLIIRYSNKTIKDNKVWLAETKYLYHK